MITTPIHFKIYLKRQMRKLQWLQLDSNPQPLSSKTNTQPFSQTDQMIELCCDYLYVRTYLTVYKKNLECLANEIYTLLHGLSPPIINDFFELRCKVLRSVLRSDQLSVWNGRFYKIVKSFAKGSMFDIRVGSAYVCLSFFNWILFLLYGMVGVGSILASNLYHYFIFDDVKKINR